MTALRRPSRSHQIATAWLLIGVILLQPLVTFFASPWFTSDARGQLVVVCTLYGLAEMYVENGNAIDPATEDSCPALELIQITASAVQPKAPLVISPLFYSIWPSDQTTCHQHHLLHYSAYHTRAPPMV